VRQRQIVRHRQPLGVGDDRYRIGDVQRRDRTACRRDPIQVERRVGQIQRRDRSRAAVLECAAADVRRRDRTGVAGRRPGLARQRRQPAVDRQRASSLRIGLCGRIGGVCIHRDRCCVGNCHHTLGVSAVVSRIQNLVAVLSNRTGSRQSAGHTSTKASQSDHFSCQKMLAV